MKKFFYIGFKVFTLFLILYGLSSFNDNEVICLIIAGIYIFLYLANIEYQKLFYQKYYVESDIFIQLCKRYDILKQNIKYLPENIQDELHNMNTSNNPFDEDFDDIISRELYYKKNLKI